MKRKIILMTLLIGTSLAAIHAQHDVLSAGGDISSGGGSVAFSIGQVAYINFPGESGSVSQGVQQPNIFNIVSTEDLDKEWTAALYPNPASDLVYLDLKNDNIFKKYNNLNIHLFDVNGKLIAQKEILAIITSFPLIALTDAVYILQINTDHQVLKSFKLYKSN